MKKEKSLILAIVITVFCFTRYANATVLGTIENSSGSGASGELSSMVFSLSYPQDDDWESVSLSWYITPDDIGRTLVATADTHPNFGAFTDMLTNGEDDLLLLVDIESFNY